jgi:hypothetical protein
LSGEKTTLQAKARSEQLFLRLLGNQDQLFVQGGVGGDVI